MYAIYFGGGQYLTSYSANQVCGERRIAVCIGGEKNARKYCRSTAVKVLRDARRVMAGGWLIPA